MILQHYIVVAWRFATNHESDSPVKRDVMNLEEFLLLQICAGNGRVVILEAWEIGTGKCISN